MIAIVDPDLGQKQLLQIPVVANFEGIEVDGWVLTTTRDPQATYDAISGGFPPGRLLIPDLLSVRRDPAEDRA